MNENIDLTEILKDCPEGTELYSAVHGKVHFVEVVRGDDPYPILVKQQREIISFTAKGLYEYSYDGEILLFPSKDQRDWSKWECPKPKFDSNTLKPFDKVLVRINESFERRWYADLISLSGNNISDINVISGMNFDELIPYNDDTKHLIGTSDEAPEYYRYWEK